MHSIWTIYFATFLLLACLIDLRDHRIPNWLNFSGFVVSLLFIVSAASPGAQGLSDAFAGLAICLLIFLPLYLLGGMGAGDVKMIAVVGFVLGLQAGIMAALLSLICGSVIGLAVLLLSRINTGLNVSYLDSIKTLFQKNWNKFVLTGNPDVRKHRFPYAVAIAAGSGLTLKISGLV